MRIRLVDSSEHEATRVEVTNGRLEIDIKDKTAEEIQKVFSVPAHLANIELLTDNGDKYGDVPGYTVYSGVLLLGNTKTLILTTEADTTAKRLANAEANAIMASTAAERAKTISVETATQVTDLQLALCEVYERMEV